MQQTLTQRLEIQQRRPLKPTKTEEEKPLLNGKEILTEKGKKVPKYVTPSINREEVLQSIAFLTQYMEDLKAGKPVENICEDDPWYLVPENIAMMIENDKALLDPNIKFIRVNNLKDLIGEWDI